jgi:hypothetical protein
VAYCPVPYFPGSVKNPDQRSALFHVKDEASAVPLRRYLKKSSTEFRRDLNFEDLRPRIHGNMYSFLGKNGFLNSQSSDPRPKRHQLSNKENDLF